MTAWRVTMFNPEADTASIEQFATSEEAETFAVGVRRRHPDWEVDVIPINVNPHRN